MLNGEDLKKRVRAVDLALASGRKRKSPRTGFVHMFPPDETVSDVIPVYENFCFALALFRQKSAESIFEAKELIERLFHFQTGDGNFPIYLHDFPRAWDFLLPLKIAPVLIYLLREFSPVLGSALKEKIEKSLRLSLERIEKLRQEKDLPPVWEMRYQACAHRIKTPFAPSDVDEWFEYLVTLQILGEKEPNIPYHRKLQLLMWDGLSQERDQPFPSVLEYLFAENDGFSPRLLCDHPRQLYAALLWPEEYSFKEEENFGQFETKEGIHIFWKGKALHSFFMARRRIEIPIGNDPAKGDLFEVEAFCDLATSVTIGGRKGTVFQLGDTIEIEADRFKISLKFSLEEGTGEFLGHISKGNRPTQIACCGVHQYETYDWRIGLRTLRKSTPCLIQTEVVVQRSPLQLSEELSMAIPMACSPLST